MEKTTCNCGCATTKVEKTQPTAPKPNIWQGIGSAMLGLLYALFPKCPLCWAAWMSIFGSVGLAKISYQPWLLPVLAVLLLVHLGVLWRSIPQKGMAPFLFSLAGMGVLTTVRYLGLAEGFVYLGMALLMTGSFLTVWSGTPRRFWVVRKDWRLSQSQ